MHQPKRKFVREGDSLWDKSQGVGLTARPWQDGPRTLDEWRRMLRRTFSSRTSTQWIFQALWDSKARYLPELANGLERSFKRGRYRLAGAIWQLPDKRRAGRALCAALERCPLDFLPQVAPFAAIVATPRTASVASARFAEAVSRHGHEPQGAGVPVVLGAAGAVLLTNPVSEEAAKILASALMRSDQAVQQVAARALQWCWRERRRRPRGSAARALLPALRSVLKSGDEELFCMLANALRQVDKRATEIRLARILQGLEKTHVVGAACTLLELRTATATKTVKTWLRREAALEEVVPVVYSSRAARKFPGVLWPTLELAVDSSAPSIRFCAAELLCDVPGLRAAKLARRGARDEPDSAIRYLFLARAATGARRYKVR